MTIHITGAVLTREADALAYRRALADLVERLRRAGARRFITRFEPGADILCAQLIAKRLARGQLPGVVLDALFTGEARNDAERDARARIYPHVRMVIGGLHGGARSLRDERAAIVRVGLDANGLVLGVDARHAPEHSAALFGLCRPAPRAGQRATAFKIKMRQ